MLSRIPLNIAIWQPESVLDKMSPYVRKMHTKSGLVERIRASTISVEDAEKKAIEKVTDYCKFQTAPLCGNTIGQDRRFLFKYMPTFGKFPSLPEHRRLNCQRIRSVVARRPLQQTI